MPYTQTTTQDCERLWARDGGKQFRRLKPVKVPAYPKNLANLLGITKLSSTLFLSTYCTIFLHMQLMFQTTYTGSSTVAIYCSITLLWVASKVDWYISTYLYFLLSFGYCIIKITYVNMRWLTTTWSSIWQQFCFQLVQIILNLLTEKNHLCNITLK